MPPEITTSVIAAVGGVVVALITSILGPLLFSIRKHAKTAAEQTKNSHSENLRDDLDLVIISLHNLNTALSVKDPLVEDRARRIRHRKEEQ